MSTVTTEEAEESKRIDKQLLDESIAALHCKLCPVQHRKQYKNIPPLEKHIEKHHTANTQTKCEKCYVRFDTHSDYLNHKSRWQMCKGSKKYIEELMEPYICPTCDHPLKKRSLLKHMRTQHPSQYPHLVEAHRKRQEAKANSSEKKEPVEQKCYFYPECQSTFLSTSNLTKHIRSVHYKIKSYRCHYCPSHFTSQFTRKRHMDSNCKQRPGYIPPPPDPPSSQT